MTNNLVVKKDMEWDSMDQQLNEHDRMFCHMLFYCLKDEVRKKSLVERNLLGSNIPEFIEVSIEGNNQEVK